MHLLDGHEPLRIGYDEESRIPGLDEELSCPTAGEHFDDQEVDPVLSQDSERSFDDELFRALDGDLHETACRPLVRERGPS